MASLVGDPGGRNAPRGCRSGRGVPAGDAEVVFWLTVLHNNDGEVLVQNGAVAEGAAGVNIASIDFVFTMGDQYPYRGAPFTRVGATCFLALQIYLTDSADGGLNGEVTAAWYSVGGEGRISDAASGGLPLTACNAADNAEPTGMLDMADIAGFVGGFFAQQPLADTAAPAGVFDLSDVVAFVEAFSGSCH